MITVHPQRWSNNFYYWTKEFVLQNIKNQIKQVIVRNESKTPNSSQKKAYSYFLCNSIFHCFYSKIEIKHLVLSTFS